MPRVVAVFAHPDDETIALGGRIARLQDAHFVHVTDGAPLDGHDSRSHGLASVQDYRRVRRDELQAMFDTAGLSHVSREALDIPDQQASRHMAELSAKLSETFRKRDPEVVFTHPYEGGHPDHDAAAFAVHMAADLLERAGDTRPLIVEAPFYHAGPSGIETGKFLKSPAPQPLMAYRLTEDERGRKDALLACFGTQTETLRYFDLQYERYRVAPQYNFLRPPHPGSAFYDSFPWGMSSNRFCELAAEAQTQLERDLAAT